MKLKAIRIGWITALVVVCLCLPVKAFDVEGPWNNSHTEVALSRDCDYIYLTAINAADRPCRYVDPNSPRDLFNTTDVYDISSQVRFVPKHWEGTHYFSGLGQEFIWAQYPSILSESYGHPVGSDFYWDYITAANHHPREGNAEIARGFGSGIHEWTFWPIELDPQISNTRVIALRDPTHKDRQWLTSYDHRNGRAMIAKTEDGWLSGEWVIDDLPYEFPGLGIYSLAIDDRSPNVRYNSPHGNPPDNPTRMAFAVTTRDQNFFDSFDPHINHVQCIGLKMTVDGGVRWSDVGIPGLPRNIYNLHVSLIALNPGNPAGSYRVYLVGLNMDEPRTPTIFCCWTNVDPNGNILNWWASAGFRGYEQTTALPNYPFDMIAESDYSTGEFHVLVATQNGMFFAEHANQTNIPWQDRNTGLTTKNFHDIAVLSHMGATKARAYVWAIAGETCTYFTDDAGAHWYPLWNDNWMIQYPQTGARQCLDSMVVLYARAPFTTLPANQTHYSPVCAQIASHQNMGSLTPFNYTYHAGWTYPVYRDFLQMDIAPIIERQRYYAAWADPFLVGDFMFTTGVAYYSEDRGVTWIPSQFNGHVWNGAAASVPKPSCIFADRVDPFMAYLSFYNPGGTGATAIPPLCVTNDGGVSWRAPNTTGLPTTAANRFIAAGRMADDYFVWMTTGSALYLSDLVNSWYPVQLPAEFDNNPIQSVTCADQWAKQVTVNTEKAFAFTQGGIDWNVVERRIFEEPRYFEQVVMDPYEQDYTYRNFWAVVYPEGGPQIRELYQITSDDNFQQNIWVTPLDWWGETPDYYPKATSLYVERDLTDPNIRRVIWTAHSATGIEHSTVPTRSVKFHECWVGVNRSPRIIAAQERSAAPLHYQLYEAYPNPFNPTTTIRFDVEEDGQMSLLVYDLSGRLVRTLVDGIQKAGQYSVVFDGASLSSGTYFVCMKANRYTRIQKLLLVK